jgi:hypothetical protein
MNIQQRKKEEHPSNQTKSAERYNRMRNDHRGPNNGWEEMSMEHETREERRYAEVEMLQEYDGKSKKTWVKETCHLMVSCKEASRGNKRRESSHHTYFIP